MHYYEDGNVRLTTSKSVPVTAIPASATAPEIMKQIAQIEKKYQEDLNKGFTSLSEGSFKSLRRQLPVTRQKVEWEKVGGYRVRPSLLSFTSCRLMVVQLGQEIGGRSFPSPNQLSSCFPAREPHLLFHSLKMHVL